MGFIAEQEWDGKVYSDGWTRPSGGAMDIIEPATGGSLGRSGVAGPEDVTNAAARAAQAQREWAAKSFEERSAILRHAGELLEEHTDEIHPWIMRETGAIGGKAGLETHVAAEECFEAAALARQPQGEILQTAKPWMSFARRRPVGVVGVISPFNFPLILSTRSVAPALALGNSVVLKPDPRTPVTGGVLLARAFEEAGLPEGVLHVLPGGADAGEALVADPQVPVISFTGSTEGGRKVGEAAARHLKRTHLELGGNSALVILDDADLDAAVSAGAFASFMHQGQICMTTGRHLVHERIAGDYLDALREKAEGLPVGNPATDQVVVGPLIDEGQRDRVHSLVSQSVDGGAKLVTGGTYEDLFYQPTVLSDLQPDSPAYRNEVFGPVAPVRSFSDVEQAVAMAADSDHGLSLGIMTGDVMRGVEIADRVPSGIVHINEQTVGDEAVAPFGGVADSGNGSRLGGTSNLEAFTEIQWLTMQGQPTRYF
ncbi:aldehyde dehydrogenase family protein [Egibacter rhizosphaerae]|uniref:Aldehyde dehydrogenase family protein n=1 Tax=Egibacter rhizosphaerae TaxID=1670831 RepID=A0A411YJC8_9ACTN|nr:benzaldehyde dehydrogenase [Egibacter rhizosphaerae]QBI21313.1 aldehyde dehydrogenase family protein [Egibacter rhizosphaerae]